MGKRKNKPGQGSSVGNSPDPVPHGGNGDKSGALGTTTTTTTKTAPSQSGAENSGKKIASLPKPSKASLIVNVSGGARSVSQSQGNDPRKQAGRPDVQQLPRRGGGDANNSNTNSNANSSKTIKKGKPETGTVNAKGKYINLEGKALLRALADQRIFELRKRNLSFPFAKFFCRLCDYHLDRVGDCERHVDESRHRRKKEASDSQGILEHIPDPSQNQIMGLDMLVRSVASKEGLTEEELETRKDVVQRLQAVITNFREDIKLIMYGSSLSGFGQKGSDINIDVYGKGSHPSNLMTVCTTLQEHGAPEFVSVQSDYNAKVPVVRLTDAATGLQVVFGINAQPAVLTSTLLQMYSMADPRVKPLAVTFRNWAKLCHLDRQEEGTLPPFAYSIMLVYFLQQIEPPVLPTLNIVTKKTGGDNMLLEEIDFDSAKEEAMEWQSENQSCLGLLWLQLLKFYCLEFDHTSHVVCIRKLDCLTRQEKKWASKKLAIEDPFSTKKNIASSMTNQMIYEYYESCLRKAYEYYAMPRDKDGNISISLAALKELANRKTDSLLQENEQPSSSSGSSSSTSQSDDGPPTSKGAGRRQHQESITVEEEDEEEEAGRNLRQQSSGSDQSVGEVIIRPNLSIAQKLKAASGGQKTPVTKATSAESSRRNTEPSGKTTASAVKVSASSSEFSESDAGSRTSSKKSESNTTTTDSASGAGLSDCYVTASETDLAEGVTVDNVAADSSAADTSVFDASEVDGSMAEASGYNTSAFNTSLLDSSVLSPKGVPSTRNVSSNASSSEVDTSKRAPSEDGDSSLSDMRRSSADAGFSESRASTDCDVSQDSGIPRTSTDTFISEKINRLHISQEEENVEEIVDEFENLHVFGGYVQEHKSAFQDIGDPSEPSAPCPEDDYSDVYGYLFTEDVFTGGKGPAVICGYCEKEGHIKTHCPEDRLPLVRPLRPMTLEHLQLLNEVIGNVIYDFCPNELQVYHRQQTVKDLETFVRQIYPDANFSLFGSSCNGFGFHSSDLDICMTFRNKTVEDIDVVEVIETLYKKLHQKRSLTNVIAIPTAKVPIVKFYDREIGLEGDISLYNILAQRNTKLLACCSQIDPRVRQLGYAVKIFAKVCCIGDASRGSLSSYGYILMMLHYLQQCRPPVIPVLQELRPVGEWPEVIVEGCNTWFFGDIHLLPKVWEGYGQNRQSVGELWLGFLCYYLEEFDWKGMVVSVRQRAKITKFEKMWTGKTIAVEDPFDLNHNLGGGLSRKMNNFIYSTFVNGRMHFGTPITNLMKSFQSYGQAAEYFFQAEKLQDGKPPNDRGCRLCGKIGHLVKDCPHRGGGKRKQAEKETEKGKDAKEVRDQKQQEKQPEKEKKKESSKKAKEKTKVEGQGQEKTKVEGQGQEKTKVEGQGQEKASSKVKGGSATPAGETKEVKPKARAVKGPSAIATTTAKTTATSPSSLTSQPATTTTISSPRVPPGFAAKPAAQPRPLQSAAFGSAAGQPLFQSSTPIRAASTVMHPPGVQMDVQQLFSLMQQTSGKPMSLSSPQTMPTSPSAGVGMGNPLQLTPEQQVAMFGGSPLMNPDLCSGISPSKRLPQKPAPMTRGEHAAATNSEQGNMTPVSVESLFHARPSEGSASLSHGGLDGGATSKTTPVPLKALFPMKTGSGPLSPNKSGTEAGGSPHMTPIPLSSLFPQAPWVQMPPQQTASQQQPQQLIGLPLQQHDLQSNVSLQQQQANLLQHQQQALQAEYLRQIMMNAMHISQGNRPPSHSTSSSSPHQHSPSPTPQRTAQQQQQSLSSSPSSGHQSSAEGVPFVTHGMPLHQAYGGPGLGLQHPPVSSHAFAQPITTAAHRGNQPIGSQPQFGQPISTSSQPTNQPPHPFSQSTSASSQPMMSQPQYGQPTGSVPSQYAASNPVQALRFPVLPMTTVQQQMAFMQQQQQQQQGIGAASHGMMPMVPTTAFQGNPLAAQSPRKDGSGMNNPNFSREGSPHH